jgi:hypothetical protein
MGRSNRMREGLMAGSWTVVPSWKRVAVGGVALGAASLVAGAAPAGAAEPTVVAECLVNAGQESGRLILSGFPPSSTLNMFIILDGAQTPPFVWNGPGNFLTTSSAGSVTTSSTPSGPPDRPVHVAVAVYRDRDGNARWDPDSDETLYRGDGVVTSCPQALTLTPK